ncbi:hypothetical protein A374_05466 [Fictibacillus macauensis ZFHKF-1]|uniref:DinB family protein n=1 Tax=Fictibacillus macauensis ZFHKF-1 TaxID=1196324 RepID=I8AKL6_9BACL|nr:DinB family protein [Fictibacillus macauensis]EIT86387.1 hypothetical protein A374_05466 [Fictibacillus macauensis ZFHKF-1]
MDSALKNIHYHRWANKKWFMHVQALPAQLTTTELKSVFPSIRDTLLHMVKTDYLWYAVISGKSYDEVVMLLQSLTAELECNLDELHKKHENLLQQFVELLEQTEDSTALLTIHHPALGEATAPLCDFMQHVVNHGTYHRGNLSAMLHQLGEKGVATDYIYYMYEQQKVMNTKN